MNISKLNVIETHLQSAMFVFADIPSTSDDPAEAAALAEANKARKQVASAHRKLNKLIAADRLARIRRAENAQ
jgi:hypothetical protein